MAGGWRGLGRFWALLLLLATGTGGILEYLGPPAPDPVGPPTPRAEPPRAPIVVRQPLPAAPGQDIRPGRDEAGPVVDPDPALLEPFGDSKTEMLPRIAADGRVSMRLYAAGFDPTTTRPRIGILIAGLGLNSTESKAAITDLPGGVSFAISPYAPAPQPLLAAARLAGHEYLLSLPMEPLRYPLSDPGPNTLLTSLSVAQNRPRLLWALSRMQGYAGVTDIIGATRGERLADVPEQMAPIMAELGRRGLMYVAAPNQRTPVASAWSVAADLSIDETVTAADIDASLATLEALARTRGTALGIAEAPRPIVVERIGAWANGLANRGLALAPVSALMRPPEEKQK